MSTIGSMGFAPDYKQLPTPPISMPKWKMPHDVLQDTLAMQRATKIAERMAELKSKPSSDLTASEKIELAYYNSLKFLAKMNELNKVCH